MPPSRRKPASMPLNISISEEDSETDQSYSDEEGSSPIDVSSPSVSGSQGGLEGGWAHLSYPDELGSSEIASHPRSSRHHRDSAPTSRSRSGRRYSRRDPQPQRESFHQRSSRRHRSPESPDSEDSTEEFVENYSHHPPDKRFWPPGAAAVVGGYAQSSSSGPSYNVFPNGLAGHQQHPHGPSHPPSDQLVRFGHLAHMGRPGQYGNTSPPYGYGGSQYPPHHPAAMPPFFGHEQLPGHPGHPGHPGPHPAHHPHQSHSRTRGQSPPELHPSHLPPHSNAHFGGPPFGSPDLIPYGANGYLPFNPNFPPMPGAMMGHPLFNQLPRQPESPSTTSQSDTAKDEAIARLEKLILDERADREARDAAREAAMAKAAADKLAAEERAMAEKKIADEAAANARAIAMAEAEAKALEEAVKAQKAAEELAAAAAAEAKKAAEEAAAVAAEEAKKLADEAAAAAAAEAKKAAEEAAAAAAAEVKKAAEEAAAAAAAEAKKAVEEAAANKPPPEKKKPIKFKDAVGRKFNFPFHLCSTWQGMEELIRQAFLHVEVIGPHVAEGHYDLVGPSGDIILPQVWETVVEPDWTITMHMWPIPEKPKEPDPPPPEEPPAPPAPPPAAEPKKKAEAPAAKKPKVPRGDPGGFAMWMMGNNRPKVNKQPLKVGKKPEVTQ